MAGKKTAGPTHVFVVVGPTMYNPSQVTLQGVYVDEQAAMIAANNGAGIAQKLAVNYSAVYELFATIDTQQTYLRDHRTNATTTDAEGKASTKAKPQTKTPKTTAQSNGETTPKESSKRKAVPDGEANSLAGTTLATSGTLSTLTRESFNETVEKFGGVHTNKFADATSIVLGSNPGPKKLEEIADKSYPTMTEEDFYDLIGADYVAPVSKKAKKA